MIRKLLFPVLLTGLLGGCVTAGYGYRDGYYYGQPSVEYRYHDYGYPYGYYPGYGYGYYPYGYYGYPYYYGRYPYYYHYHHHHHQPKPPAPGTPPEDTGDNDRPPPWRDLDRRRTDDLTRRTQEKLPAPQARVAPRTERRSEGPRKQPVQPRTQEPRRRQSGETREP